MKPKNNNHTLMLKKELQELKPINFILLTAAGIINAFGVSLFLFPVKLYDSGTIVNATGGYSKDEKQIIFFIVNRFQINKLKTIVNIIDHTAFISIQDVAESVRKAPD